MCVQLYSGINKIICSYLEYSICIYNPSKTATGTQRTQHPGTFQHPVARRVVRDEGSPLVVSDAEDDDDDNGSLDSSAIAEKDVGGCTLSLSP